MTKQIEKCGMHGYWCTWLTQNYLAGRMCTDENGKTPSLVGDQGAKLARSMMNEEKLFGRGGWAEQWDGAKRDLYLMLDDGWDVSYGVHPADRRDAFGSLVANGERFPCTAGLTPAKRLSVLNEKAKSFGWKGIGIWVAAQRSGADFQKPFSACDEEYWRERILWCKEAGVLYWKVDWGTLEHDNAFRKFLSETAEKIYPELTIEHAICCPPLNGVDREERVHGRFADDPAMCELAREAVAYSEVFRTYDVLPPLSVATTLDRVACLLPYAKGYLNVEDEVYLAAALGCQMGIMRSVYGADLDEWGDCGRLTEVFSAVSWQRETPPFFGGGCEASDEILFDDYTFRADEVWYWVANGKRIEQGAPAAVSRNASLPVVGAGKSGQMPFTAVALHPNGNYAAAILPRTVKGKRVYVGGDVVYPIRGECPKIALFGKADSVSFLWNDGTRIESILVKSLSDGDERELSDCIFAAKNGFGIDEKTLLTLWRAKDGSAPAVVFQIKYKNEGRKG